MVWFEWDDAKARTNERKHGVRFEDAMLVFADPFAWWNKTALRAANSAGKPSASWEVWRCCWLHIRSAVAPAKKPFASSPPAKPRERSANVMTKIVRKKLSTSSITAARKRRLAKLAARPDSAIDFSDIPELTEKFWRNAIRNPFYRPIKRQLTLRLDADVIAWLRKQGKGYQTRANALLRAAMLRDLQQKAS
jgi:uncharacterized protein (DUF4415 family)